MGERVKDKAVIVTGAGSIGPGWGNGKAAAVLYAREGARVLAVDNREAAAAETKKIIDGEGGSCATFTADVSRNDQVVAMVEACLDTYGRLDVLHNNVGIAVVGGVVDTAEDDWDRVNAVNLKSVYLTCRHAIPHMIAGGAGAIVNISSISAVRWTGVPLAAYAATKAGLHGLSASIAVQYARDGVRCNTILPGFINTPLVRHALADYYSSGDIEKMIEIRDAQVPMGKMGDAWDVAHAALFLASDEARFITGQCLAVDGGQLATCLTP
jgi:NAD(P)-dependent dehydrogenase (short-subunit alcohol dehydrogenase family)